MDQRRVDNILDSGTIHLKIRSFVYLKAVNVKKKPNWWFITHDEKTNPPIN